MNKKYQVFISSTYTDMREERQAAVEAVLRAGHIPAGMELFAASNKSQMEVIKRWIDESDIFMLILGGRYGSVEKESGKSYIQLEYEYAIQTGKPYFALYLTEDAIKKKAAGALGLDAVERVDTPKYNEFRSTVTDKLCSEIEDVKDIRIHVPEAIRNAERENALDGWVRASSRGASAASQEDPVIEFFTGPGAPYHLVDNTSGRSKSTVRIGVRNTGGRTLSNCKIYIEHGDPPSDNHHQGPYLLETGAFQLRGDDPEKLVDVALRWNHLDAFMFCVPFPAGFAGATTYDMKGNGPRTFVLRAEATECRREAKFQIVTDESSVLHLTMLGYLD